MKNLIIAANLGRVRVFKFHHAGDDPIEENHLIEDLTESSDQHVQSIQQAVTDKAGRFAKGTPAGTQNGMSYGERHNLKSEMERGALLKISGKIARILESEGYPRWVLAAPQPILASLSKSLPPAARSSLDSEVGADLTRCPLQEMEKRFL